MHMRVCVCVCVCVCVTEVQALIWPPEAVSLGCASSSLQCSLTPYTTPHRAAARPLHICEALSPAVPAGMGRERGGGDMTQE